MTGVPPLEIRPYREADRAALVALWESCDLVRPWNDPAADIALCLATPHAHIFVGLEPDRAGALSAGLMCGSDGHRGWLYYLAVAPGRRRSGLARAMVRHAEEQLAERGVRKVQLMIRAENEAVREVYEHLGYQVEPRVVMSRWLDRSA
ncbi:MAG: GNAT family acetyltransferase [Gammaproteobacteria bacterium]|nr:GNAT family acetyltransferase [Gammaproteobacteria bacterium]